MLMALLFGCHSKKNNGKNDKSQPQGEMPPGAPPMPPGGFPDGMPPPPPFNLDPHENAAVYIVEGEQLESKEIKDGSIKISIADGASGINSESADGFLMTSSSYNATGIVVKKGAYKIGGKKDFYTVIPNFENDYVGTTVADKFNPDSEYNYNSVLLFGLDSQVPEDATTGSSGIDAANDGEILYIDNAYLQVDGAQRYVSSTFGDATTVVNASYLVSTGNANGYTNEIPLPFSNEALLISGSARTNFTISTSHTYFNNSIVVAEGWASLSTDAASGDGLDLYAYNTKAYALNGGYATYADFTCRVWSFGSYLEASEVGGILSKSGEIYIMDGGSAPKEVLAFNTGATTTDGSHVKAGRNALMIHAPDMMGEGLSQVDHGTVKVVNSTLETTNELKSSFDYTTYGKDAVAYLNYIKGDVILVKSTSANVTLDGATLKSSNGVLFHTVLNSDKFGNFLKEGDNKATDKDGNELVKPIRLNLKNMSTSGDILHDDYHRDMELHLVDTQLKGKIDLGSFDRWKKLWEEKGITKGKWMADDSWQGKNELLVRLDEKSSWEVTETCLISQLIIADGASITAPNGKKLKLLIDRKEVPLKAGNYEGEVLLKVE